MNELIDQTLGKVNRNRNLYKQSEFAVRDHLVNPILTYLGWDITDADFVIPNRMQSGNDTPHYALVKGGKNISFVEPKNLSENLLDYVAELALYCHQEGAEFGVLTNGIKWILLKTFGTSPKPKDRIIWQIDLENDAPMNVSRRFKSIEYNNVEKIENLIEKEKVLNDAWEEYLRKPDVINEQIADLFKNKITSNAPDIDFDPETTRAFFKRKLNEWTKHNQYLLNAGLPNQLKEKAADSADVGMRAS